MPTNAGAIELTRNTLLAFLEEFVRDPYVCYTEHGLHARFAARLYDALPADERSLLFPPNRICRIQKEYPTHTDLGKSRRAHWDVSLLGQTATLPAGDYPYDHIPVATVVEFGLNEDLAHLKDDIDRLTRAAGHVHHGFAAHLYRVSKPGWGAASRRDLSPYSAHLSLAGTLPPLLSGTNVEAYVAVADRTGTHQSGLWRVTPAGAAALTPSTPPAQVATIPMGLSEGAPGDS